PALRHLALAAQIVDATHRCRMVRRANYPVRDVSRVYDVEEIIASTDHDDTTGGECLEEARQCVAVARTVNPARSHDGERPPIGATKLFSGNLGAAVVVPDPRVLTERFVLGEQIVALLGMTVDRHRTDVQHASHLGGAAGVEHTPGGVDDLLLKQ